MIYKKMWVVFIIFLVQSISGETVHFGCGKSLENCDCHQETNDVFSVPLYTVDCSRLNSVTSPRQKDLPLFISRLDFSHNLIDKLNESTQLSSEFLYILDYSYNNIKTITPGQFKNLRNLHELNLEHNYLQNIDENLLLGLNNLKVLNLGKNALTTISMNFFSHQQQLREINLSYNNLGEFLFKLNFTFFPSNTTALRLDGVNLKNMTHHTFQGLHNLQTLTLADNPIQEMFILSFENLRHLDISGINVTKIEAKHLNFTSLKTLKMNRLKRLSTIGDFAFYYSNNIEVLTVENCQELKQIEPAVFGFLAKNTAKRFSLKKFSLARNSLQTLDGSFEFLFRNLQEVNLQGNPWFCGCGLTWFRNLKNIGDHNDTRCHTPPHLQFKMVTELKPAEYVCMENRNLYPSSVTTNQWLFPLIGFLCIVVVLLVGVLIYMGPFSNSPLLWTRSIGPDSPYNRMTVDSPYDESVRHF